LATQFALHLQSLATEGSAPLIDSPLTRSRRLGSTNPSEVRRVADVILASLGQGRGTSPPEAAV